MKVPGMTDGRSRAILRIRFRASWKRCWSVWLVARWKCMDQAGRMRGCHAMGADCKLSPAGWLQAGCGMDPELSEPVSSGGYCHNGTDHGTGVFSQPPERRKKIYTYQIETGTKKNVFSRRTCYGLGQALDITAMQKAAELLCGTHDYKSFCGNKKMKKSTVRTIYRIAVEQEADSSLVKLEFEGTGFLQNMVRILAGTLIEVGTGKREPAVCRRFLLHWTVRQQVTRHRQKDFACSRYFMNKQFFVRKVWQAI